MPAAVMLSRSARSPARIGPRFSRVAMAVRRVGVTPRRATGARNAWFRRTTVVRSPPASWATSSGISSLRTLGDQLRDHRVLVGGLRLLIIVDVLAAAEGRGQRRDEAGGDREAERDSQAVGEGAGDQRGEEAVPGQ